MFGRPFIVALESFLTFLEFRRETYQPSHHIFENKIKERCE